MLFLLFLCRHQCINAKIAAHFMKGVDIMKNKELAILSVYSPKNNTVVDVKLLSMELTTFYILATIGCVTVLHFGEKAVKFAVQKFKERNSKKKEERA